MNIATHQFCGTCGKPLDTSSATERDCAACKAWWQANPPPTEAALDVSDRVQNDAVRERVARAMFPNLWQRKDAGGAGVSMDGEIAHSLDLAGKAVAALATPPAPVEGAFKLGERVTKTKGSSWTGRIVGTYSTSLTPEGYAVESENEPGSVQIYPASALRATASPVERDLLANRVLVEEAAQRIHEARRNTEDNDDRSWEELLAEDAKFPDEENDAYFVLERARRDARAALSTAAIEGEG